MKITGDRLIAFITAAVAARRVAVPEARMLAESLVEAEMEGQASHGLIRLPFLLRRLDAGLINPRPEIRVVTERPGAALVDGDNGLGPVVGLRALEMAMAKARAAGSAVVAVRRSNHLGAVGFYVQRAARDGLVAFAFSNTPPAMAPPGGRTPFLGTNPIAAAFPTPGEPVVIDLATSQVARGRILKAAKTGQTIPAGWAVDAEGRETQDARAALEGSLLPLGGPKGFALALAVEVLAGVLSGAAVGPEVGGTFAATDRPSDVGHCFWVIDPTAFGDGFGERMSGLADAIRSIVPIDPADPVRVPGDRRASERARRAPEGVDVAADLIVELEELAGESLS